MSTICVGMHATYIVIPGPESTAAAIGNDGVQVVSTPHIIGLLEETSHRAVRDFFEAGQASVGTKVNISHLAPAYPGRTLVCNSALVAIDGRRLRFEVKAEQDGREIMRGEHERALIRLDRFQAPPVEAPSAQKSIEFFFDYHSPWCYLALERIAGVAARHQRKIIWKPFHLANLITQIDGRRPLDANPAFVRWFKQDMQDWASVLNVALRYHPNFPLRPSRAQRASVYADSQGKAFEFVRATMRAYWAEQRDISDLAVLGEIATQVGLDAETLMASTSDEQCKAAVEANTAEAIARGVFGAPTFFAGERMFWGNDRLEMLERHLVGGLRPVAQ